MVSVEPNRVSKSPGPGAFGLTQATQPCPAPELVGPAFAIGLMMRIHSAFLAALALLPGLAIAQTPVDQSKGARQCGKGVEG